MAKEEEARGIFNMGVENTCQYNSHENVVRIYINATQHEAVERMLLNIIH